MSLLERVRAILPPSAKDRLRPWRRGIGDAWRRFRVQPVPTAVLGPQFTPSRRYIELDINYACNLKCVDCNRSSPQAPTGQRMSVQQVERFVEESIEAGIAWQKIRLLGGEPTLHPQLLEILEVLRRYRTGHSPDVRIMVVTNGHGPKVNRVLASLPADVEVENTAKDGEEVVAGFYSFTLAPADLPEYSDVVYENGCRVVETCGMGMTPSGFYACAVAGNIDRVFGLDMGRQSLPEADDAMRDQLAQLCRYCGRFKYDRRDQKQTSASWRRAYADFAVRRPTLSRY